MEYSPIDHSAEVAHNGAAEIRPSLIQREMLSRSLANPFLNRIATAMPLLIIGFSASNVYHSVLLWLLVAIQCAATFLAACTAARVKRTIDSGNNAKNERRAWLASEALAGSIWGLMLIATTDHTEPGIVTSVVAVAVLCTITASALVAAIAPGLSRAILLGFAITSWPVVLLNYEAFGPLAGLAVMLLIPCLWWLSSSMGYNAYHALKTELENHSLTEQLAAALESAEYLSRHDALTGLLNRRDFERAAHDLRDSKPDATIALIVADLDRFKQINDRHGHATGDQVLVAAADILRSRLRATDIESRNTSKPEAAIARWGGEEFIAALAVESAFDAPAAATRICRTFAEYTDPEWPSGLSLTASLGVAIWHPRQDLDTAIGQADLAMYEAKSAGRNCVREAREALAA